MLLRARKLQLHQEESSKNENQKQKQRIWQTIDGDLQFAVTTERCSNT